MHGCVSHPGGRSGSVAGHTLWSGRLVRSTTPIDVVFDGKRMPVLMHGHELERVEQAQEREA